MKSYSIEIYYLNNNRNSKGLFSFQIQEMNEIYIFSAYLCQGRKRVNIITSNYIKLINNYREYFQIIHLWVFSVKEYLFIYYLVK